MAKGFIQIIVSDSTQDHIFHAFIQYLLSAFNIFCFVPRQQVRILSVTTLSAVLSVCELNVHQQVKSKSHTEQDIYVAYCYVHAAYIQKRVG